VGRKGKRLPNPTWEGREKPELRVWCLTHAGRAVESFPAIPQVEGPRYQQVPLCSPRMGMSQGLMTGPWILSQPQSSNPTAPSIRRARPSALERLCWESAPLSPRRGCGAPFPLLYSHSDGCTY